MILNNDVLEIIRKFLVIDKCMKCNRKRCQLYENFYEYEISKLNPVYCSKCYDKVQEDYLLDDDAYFSECHNKFYKCKAIPLYFSRSNWRRWLNPKDKRGKVCYNVLQKYHKRHLLHLS